MLWNERDLAAFIPAFLPTIYYVDVPTGHEVTNATEMTSFASKWYECAPVCQLTLTGTQTGPLPNGHKPTARNSASTAPSGSAGEACPQPPEHHPSVEGIGGDMYYDRATMAQQLGLASDPGLSGPGG
jgi:hypothetical protein